MTRQAAPQGSTVAYLGGYTLTGIPSGQTVITASNPSSELEATGWAFFEFGGVDAVGEVTSQGASQSGIYDSGTVSTTHAAEAWTGAAQLQGTAPSSPSGWTAASVKFISSFIAGYQTAPSSPGSMNFSGTQSSSLYASAAIALYQAAASTHRNHSPVPAFKAARVIR
jgi:hypothetical protein